MEPISSITLASGGHESDRSLMKLSITELISMLRSAFRNSDFDHVEEALVAKETKMNAKIGALEEKLEIERLDRMSVEDQLKKKKKNGFDDDDDDDDENTVVIAGLKIKNRKLEDEKLFWKGKFEELSERVLRLENAEKLFMNGNANVGIGGNTELECRGDHEASIKVKEEKETNEVDVHGHECGKNTADSSPSQRNGLESANTRLPVGQGTSQSPVTPNKDLLGVSANGRLEMKTVIEIGESDDECIPRATFNGKEATTSQIVATVNDKGQANLSGVMQQKSLPTGVLNDVLKRKWVAGNSSIEFGNKVPNILDDFDSDDDTSTSSLESDFLEVQLPSNFLRNTNNYKRRKS